MKQIHGKKQWGEPISFEKVRTWLPWSILEGSFREACRRWGREQRRKVGLVKGGKSEARRSYGDLNSRGVF